jgi:uncharacterized protein YjbJ (UPF0337 family)
MGEESPEATALEGLFTGRIEMLWNEIEKDWKNLSNKFKTKWSKLTDADIKAIGGKRNELIERLTKQYKTERNKIEKEVDDFAKTLKPVKA